MPEQGLQAVAWVEPYSDDTVDIHAAVVRTFARVVTTPISVTAAQEVLRVGVRPEDLPGLRPGVDEAVIKMLASTAALIKLQVQDETPESAGPKFLR